MLWTIPTPWALFSMLINHQDINRKVHILVLMLMGLAGSVFPLQAVGMEITTPSGLQEIGKPLSLKSRITGLPEGTETQLRSACLKARVLPLEISGVAALDAFSPEVAVEFLPGTKNGGQLEFKSLAPVSNALVELELVSNCPLLVFETRWPLIMDPPVVQAGISAGGENLQNAGLAPVARNFDPEQSSLLALSRKRPVIQERSMPGTWAESAPQPAPQDGSTGETQDGEVQPALTSAKPAADAVQVAALAGTALGDGLIQDRGGNALTEPMAAPVQSGLYPGVGGSTWQTMALSAVLGVLFLLAAALGKYWWNRRRPAVASQSVAPTHEMDEVDSTFNPEPVKVEPVLRNPIERVTPDIMAGTARAEDNPRILETLLGSAFTQQEDEAVLASPVFLKGLAETQKRPSLAHSLDLLNRADLRKWTLPPAYAGLVEERNIALEANRTPDALLLRCHVGLVELAFQDALNGQATTLEVAGELVDTLLGTDFHELALPSPLCIPDLVKSLVRAKMCEVSGSNQRQLLRENLLSLNADAIGPALCFSMPEWREFLNEEDILG